MAGGDLLDSDDESPRKNKKTLTRRRSLGNFDQDTVASAQRSAEVNVLEPPRRRSLSNVDAQPMPERYRAPVRSAIDGEGQTSSINEKLREHFLFRSANKLFVDQIIQSMTVELFQPGAAILNEGEAAYLLYFLHRGEVQVSVKGKTVASLSDGAFFGEMALLEKNSKRKATVVANSFCDCRVIHKDRFNRLLKLFPAERMFFEAEADRRAEQLQKMKQAEKEASLKAQYQSEAVARQKKKEEAAPVKTRRPSQEKIPSQNDHVKMEELPPPYIAEAFLVTAMLSRAHPAHHEVGMDDESSPLRGLSTTC